MAERYAPSSRAKRVCGLLVTDFRIAPWMQPRHVRVSADAGSPLRKRLPAAAASLT